MGCKMTKDDNNVDTDFLNTEYSSISSYFNQVINFRFVSFGFFITVIGLLFSEVSNGTLPINTRYWVILILTILVWMLELRNRSLSAQLSKRAKEIEEYFFPEKKTGEEQKLKTREKLSANHFFHILDNENKEAEKTRIFGIPCSPCPLYTIIQTQGNIEMKIRLKTVKQENKTVNSSFTLFFLSHSFVMDATYTIAIIVSIIKLICK